MIWFLLTLPFRLVGLGFKMGTGSVKLTHGTLRLLGYRRLVVFGAGVGVGLLVAPGPGAELRLKLRERLEGLSGGGLTGASGGDLTSRVREQLASSPRTWHLPQPSVTCDATGRVVLSGDVPDATASGDLERVAASVRGVVAVDNRLVAPATPSA
jgi:hypothetical protein